jgi:four helix bundle protein
MRIARGLPMRPFETYDISMELVAAMGPVIAKVKRRDVDLSNQLKRAVTSIPLNLAEGAERRGKDRVQHYRVAAGSAAEVGSAISIALSWEIVTASDVQRVTQLLDRVRALVWRLLEANQDRPHTRERASDPVDSVDPVPGPEPAPGAPPGTRDPDPEPGRRKPEPGRRF